MIHGEANGSGSPLMRRRIFIARMIHEAHEASAARADTRLHVFASRLAFSWSRR
jgi:hypothetical protein